MLDSDFARFYESKNKTNIYLKIMNYKKDKI